MKRLVSTALLLAIAACGACHSQHLVGAGVAYRSTVPAGSPGYYLTKGASVCLDYPSCNSQVLESATTGNVQLLSNGGTWDFSSSSTMTFPNGSTQVGGSQQLGWTTALDCNFVTQPYQSIATDGTYTICGVAGWVKWNSLNESVHMFIDAGLSIQPAQNNADNFQGIRASPILGIPLNLIIPNLTWDTPVRIWAAYVSCNANANFDTAWFGIDNGLDGGANISPSMHTTIAGTAGMTSNSYNSSGASVWSLQNFAPLVGSTNSGSYPLTVNGLQQNMGVVQANAYQLNGLGMKAESELFTGYYDGGAWPSSFPSSGGTTWLNPRTILYPNFQAQGWIDLTRELGSVPDAGYSYAIMGVKRAGSATALNCVFARLRVDYWNGM